MLLLLRMMLLQATLTVNGQSSALVFEQSLADASTYSSASPIVNRLVVRKPDVPIGTDFSIQFA